MQNRLFSNDANKYLCVRFDQFSAAVQKGDSKALDAMLEAKKNGMELDVNGEISGKTALEIFLDRKDFASASKLLKAGADTGFNYKVWVDDDGSYPYGSYETRRRDFFQEFAHDREILIFLLNETVDSKEKIAGMAPR